MWTFFGRFWIVGIDRSLQMDSGRELAGIQVQPSLLSSIALASDCGRNDYIDLIDIHGLWEGPVRFPSYSSLIPELHILRPRDFL